MPACTLDYKNLFTFAANLLFFKSLPVPAKHIHTLPRESIHMAKKKQSLLLNAFYKTNPKTRILQTSFCMCKRRDAPCLYHLIYNVS